MHKGEKMKLSKRERYLLYGVIILAFFIFLERLVFHPLSGKLTTLNQEIFRQEVRLKKALTLQSQKERILKDYKDCEPYLKLKKVSDEEVMAKLLKEIEQMARKSRTSLVDIKPRAQPKTMHGYKKYAIELQLEARMEEIVSFLYNLRECGLLLRTEKFSISPKDERSGLLKANLLITGLAF